MLVFGIVCAVLIFIGIYLRNTPIVVVEIAREQSVARTDIRQAFVAAVGIILGKVTRIIRRRREAAGKIIGFTGDGAAHRRAGQFRFL